MRPPWRIVKTGDLARRAFDRIILHCRSRLRLGERAVLAVIIEGIAIHRLVFKQIFGNTDECITVLGEYLFAQDGCLRRKYASPLRR